MKPAPHNSKAQPPVEASALRKTNSKIHYPMLDFCFSLFYPDVDQTFQAINPNGNKSYAQADFFSDYNDDQEISGREILDSERKDKNNLDSEMGNQKTQFLNQPDDEDINPNRNVPEEDNDLKEDDGAIINEPTREIDDPYRPGHADEENIPPIQKEFPNANPEENIKTDY